MVAPPIVQDSYTPDQCRYIAGFLLRQRDGVLQAYRSVSDPTAEQIPSWQSPQMRYFRDCEAFTRYLLWICGYPVEPWGDWEGDVKYVYPRVG